MKVNSVDFRGEAHLVFVFLELNLILISVMLALLTLSLMVKLIPLACRVCYATDFFASVFFAFALTTIDGGLERALGAFGVLLNLSF